MNQPPKSSWEAVVVSATWPDEKTGYGLAVTTGLREYCRFFSRVHFFGPCNEAFDGGQSWAGENVRWIPLVRPNGPRWRQFLRSLATANPAITVRFRPAARPFLRQVGEILRQASRRSRGLAVIYEDVPTAYLLLRLRRRRPAIPQALRSHNCLDKGFDGMDRRGGLLNRLAWRTEFAKIRRFERAVCLAADALWAITAHDAEEYRRRTAMEVDGVFGVSVDARRYADLPPGDAATVVHVGSADLRKGAGLGKFIAESWPLVRAAVPHARLVIGGRGTEVFHRPTSGIEALGRVDDDRLVLRQGSIFINPQEIGAGIKLKSVVAMLSGKALVSTPTGIEGVEGTGGSDFFMAADPRALADLVVMLIRTPELSLATGRRARATAADHYRQERVSRSVGRLLEALVSGQPAKVARAA